MNSAAECAASSLRAPDGVDIHVWEFGRTPPSLCFIHGFGDGAFVWRHLVPSFAKFGASLAVDLRGHGDSGHDPAGDYSMEQHVADVARVLGDRAPRPVTLMGHSLGAEVAIRLAARNPEHVRAIVVVDGGPDLNPEALDHFRQAFSNQSWFYGSVAEYATLMISRLPLADPNLVKSVARNALMRVEEETWQLKCDRALADALRFDDTAGFWASLRQARCPILLVRGAASAVLPRASAERMAARLNRCWLRSVPNAGHAVMLDNPNALAAVTCRFLNELS
jgi:pimeloyl-ACP methyl ester carboxylesterase